MNDNIVLLLEGPANAELIEKVTVDCATQFDCMVLKAGYGKCVIEQCLIAAKRGEQLRKLGNAFRPLLIVAGPLPKLEAQLVSDEQSCRGARFSKEFSIAQTTQFPIEAWERFFSRWLHKRVTQ